MASSQAGSLGVAKVVSGGQTGADRGAWDAARSLGIATGGWVPRGRRAEDGAVPERYTGLAETGSDSFRERTELNVRDSDATLLLSSQDHFLDPLGSPFTEEHLRAHTPQQQRPEIKGESEDHREQRIQHGRIHRRPALLH